MTKEPRLVIHCDGGLANRINCLVNGLLIANLWSLDLELVWPINRYCRAEASDLLLLDMQPLDKSKNQYCFRSDTGIVASDNFLSISSEFAIDPGTCRSRKEFIQGLNMLLKTCQRVIIFYPLPLPQFYFDARRIAKSLSFSPQLTNLALREQARLGLKSFWYWGLHLRGTDAKKTNSYYMFFARLCRILPGRSLVLTDDPDIVKLFSFLSPRVMTRRGISLVNRSHNGLAWDHASIDENGQKLPYNVNRSAESVQEALVDLILLSRSISLPTSTSTFLELSLFLNPVYGGLIGYFFYVRAKINLQLKSRFPYRNKVFAD